MIPLPILSLWFNFARTDRGSLRLLCIAWLPSMKLMYTAAFILQISLEMVYFGPRASSIVNKDPIYSPFRKICLLTLKINRGFEVDAERISNLFKLLHRVSAIFCMWAHHIEVTVVKRAIQLSTWHLEPMTGSPFLNMQ